MPSRFELKGGWWEVTQAFVLGADLMRGNLSSLSFRRMRASPKDRKLSLRFDT